MSEILYSYEPADWNQERFLSLGGFTVVFLNYNKLPHIRTSVAAALAQDFPQCEMFFMDDASTDGSDEEMSGIVKAYRGPHKVVLIRNAVNRGITGQWNAVARLASGNWFGMFCGDDVSLPNRVTVAARIAKENPELLGFCTSGIMVDVANGRETGRIGCYEEFGAEKVNTDGQAVLTEVNDERHPIVGATAFWHHSLFDRPLPAVPLDDVLLRWIVQQRIFGTSRRGFLWDGTSVTIRYGMGCGITSGGAAAGDALAGSVAAERQKLERKRYHGRLHARTWSGIRNHFAATAAPARLQAFAGYSLVLNEIAASGTGGRLAILPRLVRLSFARGMRLCWTVDIWGFWVAKTFREFLGLAPLAHVNALRRRKWT